jgi:hypothetical protein
MKQLDYGIGDTFVSATKIKRQFEGRKRNVKEKLEVSYGELELGRLA